MSMKKKNYAIFYLILLMIALVLVIGRIISQSQETANIIISGINQAEISQLSESEIFARASFAQDLKNLKDIKSQKSLQEFYGNRAFPGAPPVIPHPLVNENTIGSINCLQCHQNGGYVSKFKAFAPITPHPNYESCLQCHVPALTQSQFKNIANQFKKTLPQTDVVQVGLNRPIGSPLVIPHAIREKANCLSCHAGPSAPTLIRTSHPERVNCLQCHVPSRTSSIEEKWTRGIQ